MVFIKIKEALTAKIYSSEHGLMAGEIVIFGQSLIYDLLFAFLGDDSVRRKEAFRTGMAKCPVSEIMPGLEKVKYGLTKLLTVA